MNTSPNVTPQLRLRTNLIAGESVDACQRNMESWRKQLAQKCAKRGSGYYQNNAPGYAPWLETEMQPWQAGDV
jgi:hypothetical protein